MRQPFARLSVAMILGLGMLMLAPAPTRAATPAQVDAGIEKAKAWLYSQQKDDMWEDQPNLKAPVQVARGHGGGMTALAIYALLASGDNPQQPALAKGIEKLKRMDIKGVYALAVRCQVWLLLPQKPDVVAAMRKDAARLMDMAKTQGEARGMFDYHVSGSGGAYSHSRSQYGVLGLWAAAQSGVEVSGAFWQMVEGGWLSHQDASGGWSYLTKATGSGGVTPGMTAPGIATLFITQEYLHASDGIGCRGNLPQPAIDAAVAWLEKNFDKVATDGRYTRDFPYATLFAVERAALASGLKRFGSVDWYDKGADWLVRSQKPDGSFNANGGTSPGENGVLANLPDTCFSLLFLSRGRAPVMVNKLEYATTDPKGVEKPGNWNQRPREVANLTRWFGRQSERFFNWQIVTLKKESDLDDAPVLYIAGNQSLAFKPAELDALRGFVERGGLILGNADCASKPFADSFRKLGSTLFPAYEFRELPQTHPIFTNQQYDSKKWRVKPRVTGLSNGVRELMILFPQDDPGKLWQLQNFVGRAEMSQLPADILLYATDKLSRGNKGEGEAPANAPAGEAGKPIKLARVEYNGNWNPEPGGWRRMVKILHDRHATELTVSTEKLGDGKLGGYAAAHLTGTGPVKFDDKSKEDLKAFVTGGGLLVVDAAGGDAQFAESAQQELTALFGDDGKQLADPLPSDHAIYKAAGKLPPEVYRNFAKKSLSSMTGGRLRGITLNGRTAVVLSREDLSNGLVGQPVDGILGYQPPAAEALMWGILSSVTPKEPGPREALPKP